MIQNFVRTTKKSVKLTSFSASFKKFDFTDPLNFKSLLDEEELMVHLIFFRSSTIQNNLQKEIWLLVSYKTIVKKNLTEV